MRKFIVGIVIMFLAGLSWGDEGASGSNNTIQISSISTPTSVELSGGRASTGFPNKLPGGSKKTETIDTSGLQSIKPDKVELSNSKQSSGFPERVDPNKPPVTVVSENAGDDAEISGNEMLQTSDSGQNVEVLQKEYEKTRENEQSWANKALTAGTTLATGLGGMEWAQGVAEQRADAAAESEMAGYLAGMRCEYGKGNTVNLGDETKLPGGNELGNYYAEYKQIADRLKQTKAALGLRPGIESEVLYERAQTDLYQYQTAEIQSGGNPSVSRALMNPDSEDAEKWNAQKAESAEKVERGKIAAGVGAIGGVIGNALINEDNNKQDTKATTAQTSGTNTSRQDNVQNNVVKNCKVGKSCKDDLKDKTHVAKAIYDSDCVCRVSCKTHYIRTDENTCVPNAEKQEQVEHNRDVQKQLIKEGAEVYKEGTRAVGDALPGLLMML